jgi:hypothetical protein
MFLNSIELSVCIILYMQRDKGTEKIRSTVRKGYRLDSSFLRIEAACLFETSVPVYKTTVSLQEDRNLK